MMPEWPRRAPGRLRQVWRRWISPLPGLAWIAYPLLVLSLGMPTAAMAAAGNLSPAVLAAINTAARRVTPAPTTTGSETRRPDQAARSDRVDAAADLAAVVIGAIAHHPEQVREIVNAAASAAPAAAQIVAVRAEAAFPVFAGAIFEAAQRPDPAGTGRTALGFAKSELDQPFGAAAGGGGAKLDIGGFDQVSDPALNAKYWLDYPKDAAAIATAPFRWTDGQWQTAAAVAGVTVGLFAVDAAIRDFAQHNRNGITNSAADITNMLGDGRYAFAGMASLYLGTSLAGEIVGRRPGLAHFQEAVLLSIESAALTGLSAEAIKRLVGRKRPNKADSRFDFDPGALAANRNSSFVSGHASGAFAVASVLASEYEAEPWVGAAAYSVAGLTAIGRVNDNKHWASDVFLGSALGYFIGKFVAADNPFDLPKGAALAPEIGGDRIGLRLRYRE